MMNWRLAVFVGMYAVVHSFHTKDHLPKTTLELFTQFEPDIAPWWLQRVGEIKPFISNLNIFGSTLLGQDCVTLEQCVLKRLYGGPMFVITRDSEKLDELTAYYTEKGLQTIFKDDLYKGVYDFLRTEDPKSAVLFNSRKIYNFKMANKPISRITIPRDFKLTDLDLLSRIGDKVPVLFITDKTDFDEYKFSYVNHFGKFNIFDEGIEPEIK